MELKHRLQSCTGKVFHSLLIVPYGIETWKDIGSKSVNLLLIVPYGIETNGIIYTFKKRKALLIVPYGIETPLSAFLL